jgi:hypothetical protein
MAICGLCVKTKTDTSCCGGMKTPIRGLGSNGTESRVKQQRSDFSLELPQWPKFASFHLRKQIE